MSDKKNNRPESSENLPRVENDAINRDETSPLGTPDPNQEQAHQTSEGSPSEAEPSQPADEQPEQSPDLGRTSYDIDGFQPPTTTRPNRVFLSVVFIIAIASALLSGWIAYTQWQQTVTLNLTVESQSQQIARQQQDISQWRESSSEQLSLQQQKTQQADETLAKLTQQTGLVRQQLTTTQDRLRLLSSKGKQEWMLEQAIYYLTLAQNKLTIEQQVEITLALLAQADQSINDANDLNLSSVRQAIHDDRVQVSSLPKSDPQGLLHQLIALEKLSTELTPQALKLPNEIIDSEIETAQQEWFDRLLNTLEKIGDDAIKFRTHDDKVQPMLTSEQQMILKNVLQLTFSQAQTSVLRNDPVYFQSRLDFAKEIIGSYFENNDKAISVVSAIDEIKQVPIHHQIDYQLQSLAQLMAIKEQRRLNWYSQPVESENQGDQQ